MASAAEGARKRVVFLGTPEVAALAFRTLMDASKAADASFEIAAVVTQPGKPKGRGNKAIPTPSPVEAAALAAGVAPDRILCPRRAKEPEFLAALAGLAPDLAVTAAYGNMLPQAFLDLPRHGTLNIHPSLLPAYRGAAPVQRAVEDGVAVTGVSVAYTVLACDAGPVLAQRERALDPDIQAPALLEDLFLEGAQLLVSCLPDVWSGAAEAAARPQDHSAAINAPKLTKEEGLLDWQLPAASLHNRVRAFAGWPGTTADFEVEAAAAAGAAAEGGGREQFTLKVLRTRLPSPAELGGLGLAADALAGGRIAFGGPQGGFLVGCGGGSMLEVLQVQPPTKKAMAARDFGNGLGKRCLFAVAPERLGAAAGGGQQQAAAAAGAT